jgi:hypothetical protein
MAAPMLATYRYPAAGAPPSLAQMRKLDQVVVDIDTDAANANEDPVVITHNLQLAPADGTDGRPEVQVTRLVNAAALTDLKVGFTSLNTLTLTKAILTRAATFRVTIRRPNTIYR